MSAVLPGRPHRRTTAVDSHCAARHRAAAHPPARRQGLERRARCAVRRGRAGAAAQPRGAAGQRLPPERLRGAAGRQDDVLRDGGARDRPDLGLHRHPVARPRRLLRARRLCDGHVPDAPDRARRQLQERPAGLHGVPRLEGAAVALGAERLVPRHPAAGGAGAGAARLRVRLLRLPLAHQGRVLLDHHAGGDVRDDAAVLPQRDRLRRQQRLHRLQAHPRHADRHAGDAHAAVRDHRPDADRLLPVRALAGAQQVRPRAAGDPRCRDAA